MIDTVSTGSRDGRRERGDRSRGAILAEAVRLASETGLEGLTFGRVSSEANVPKSSIQVLFGSREKLQLATLDEAMDIYRRTVVEPAMFRNSPLDRLTALLEGWYDFVRSRTLPGGCFLNAVSSEFRCRPGPIRERIQTYRQNKRTRFRELIEQGQRVNELRGDLETEQLVFAWVACEAVANVAALMGDEEEFEHAREVALWHLRAATRSMS
ncbi:TetR/AcrR family transcriptional regulator [Enterobacter sp. DTU_2021_1002640_1_SI_PRY_ASU_LCPMC_013]|uniref:TetR/AcrR family transcriptional regulator n=1 Tax=Enterobacter sp. DTU_2021_1002640_1_SI_PRY_ASU_LCPMC_013 TaxID=3077940 RepID=UPI0028E9F43C|nr:TetR/AcrR family transcriptional regulator [Enterobacter sp. DTU_2021_1002640_1_SI_PRY_ASU_LCPMC_013]WNU98977.1 TetR/AcrR family transcriptional regulator [Enterobacter sp. DTU_2021_1002640_1_SI_PRY_ASU_LCPMC_013]